MSEINKEHQTGVCPDEQALAAYLDKGLSPEDRGRFETHLAHCAACREAVAELRALLGAELPDAPEETKRRARNLPKS